MAFPHLLQRGPVAFAQEPAGQAFAQPRLPGHLVDADGGRLLAQGFASATQEQGGVATLASLYFA